MRVIAGDRRGFKLKSPKGHETRPTEDFIKEMIFNIIQPVKYGAVAVDLFSGSGSIGIEFLSRGASKVYFVEKAQGNIKLISDNLEHTKFLEEAIILHRDAVGAIFNINEEIDYFYLDPPYKEHDLLMSTLEAIDDYSLLNENSLIIVETTSDFEREFNFKRLRLKDIRKKRKKLILFFNLEEI